MDQALLPTFAPLADYEQLAAVLLDRLQADDPVANGLFRQLHPQFRRMDVPWLPRATTAADVPPGIGLDDARLAVARAHAFLDWAALSAWVADVTEPGSATARFEGAVDAVIDGDLPGLEALLASDPDLPRARSTRGCCFDPPVHRATLLHYVAANGVEDHRQRTPPNAVAILTALLRAGAEPDAEADLYGSRWTTVSLLVSSSHPAEAGLQVPLLEALAAFGAALDGSLHPPLRTALTFGMTDAAEALVRLGAEVRDLPTAAGLGRLDLAQVLLPDADPAARHLALALAAQLGRVDVVRLLLDAGEDPNRYNPPGAHPHATPLHHAALHGHEAVVRLLVDRGAALDLRDRIYDSDPAGWARHAGQVAIADALRARAGG
ncbi:MAG: ankyrin repeat domain-containing protein [Myxococcota bacterium]